MSVIKKQWCSLIGSNHEVLRTEIENRKREFLEEYKEAGFVVEIDLEKEKDNLMQVDYAQRMWKLWSKVVKMFSEGISDDDFKTEYEFFLEKTEWKDMIADRKLSKLLDKYEKKGIHILLIMSAFESARQIFPREHSNEMFFRRLFTLTSKSLSQKKCLHIILASTERIGGQGGIAHNMGAGSDIEAAYPPIQL